MTVDISGLTGIESPGYSQGGDPVVESGSNSDGSWTRWADGTQLTSGSLTLTNVAVTSATGSLYQTLNLYLNHPAVFTEVYFSDAFKSSGQGSLTGVFGSSLLGARVNDVAFRLVSTVSTTEDVPVSFMTIGRWK